MPEKAFLKFECCEASNPGFELSMRTMLTSQPPSQMELWAKSVERRSLELTRTNRQLRTSVDKYKKVRGVETLAASMQLYIASPPDSSRQHLPGFQLCWHASLKAL